MAKSYKHLLRILITFGLLFVVSRQIEWWEFLNNALNKDYLLIAIIVWIWINILNVYVSSLKLRYIVSLMRTASTNIGNIFHIYLVSSFFALFVPSSIGWDLSKAALMKVSYSDMKTSRIVYALFIERLSGLISLLLIIFISFIIPSTREIYYNFYSYISEKLWIITLLVVITFIALAVMVLYKYREKIKTLAIGFTKKNILQVIWLSLLFQIIMLTNNFFIFYVITGISNPIYMLIFVPIVVVVSTLPISIQWIWVRDTLWVMILPLLISSLVNEDIFLYTSIMNIIVVMSALIWGIYYFIYNFFKK